MTMNDDELRNRYYASMSSQLQAIPPSHMRALFQALVALAATIQVASNDHGADDVEEVKDLSRAMVDVCAAWQQSRTSSRN